MNDHLPTNRQPHFLEHFSRFHLIFLVLSSDNCHKDFSKKKLEQKQLNSASGSANASSNAEVIALQRVVDKLDPAKKRIVFHGWPETYSAEKRIQEMRRVMKDKCHDVLLMDAENFYTGPYSDRKISKASYVELVSESVAKRTLGVIGGKMKLHEGGDVNC